MKRIYHIINTYNSKDSLSSGLDAIQELTVNSLIAANKHFGHAVHSGEVQICLCYIKHESDSCVMPPEFVELPSLQKSVLDYFSPKADKKNLPLLADILNSVSSLNPDGNDSIIYSNADISVMPTFYSFAFEALKQYDTFVINRRDIPKLDSRGIAYTKANLSHLYTLKGSSHPGFDCFVMPYDMIKHLALGKVFLGYPPVGSVLKKNMERLSQRFVVFDEAHQTFHLGKDTYWRMDSLTNSEYYEANLRFASEVGLEFRKLKMQ